MYNTKNYTEQGGDVTHIGGATYFLIEILWRGYSHWTMFLLGDFAF